MSLLDLIRAPRRGIDEIALHLEALDEEAVRAAILGLNRGHQRALYEKAAGGPPLELGELVAGAGVLEEVVHDGRNTLPVPGRVRRFQKRFCRPRGTDAELYGFNEGIARPWIGPGYFVARATAGRPRWAARGDVVIDYTEVPSDEVAPGWPRVVPNGVGLQRFVFRGTRDFLRRITEGITIGAAYKSGRPLDHYFVLIRAR